MKYRKIRGIGRRLKSVDHWRDHFTGLSIEDLLLNEGYYAKINVDPWGVSRISLTDSEYPEPKGAVRQKIFSALLDIYDTWEKTLNASGKPYYLALWIYDPFFQKSQVVCATGDRLHYYDQAFTKTENPVPFPNDKFISERTRAGKIRWQSCFDNYIFTDEDLGDPGDWISASDYEETKRWYASQLKKPHQSIKMENGDGYMYVFNQGIVWIGSLR